MAIEQTKFRFKGYRVIKSEMRIDQDVEIGKKLNVTFSGVQAVEHESEYLLDLGVDITNEDKSIDIKLEMRGVFEFDKEMEHDEKGRFFILNAPTIMFPYMRAHVATLTAISGIEALVLPTLNFAEGLRKAKEID